MTRTGGFIEKETPNLCRVSRAEGLGRGVVGGEEVTRKIQAS